MSQGRLCQLAGVTLIVGGIVGWVQLIYEANYPAYAMLILSALGLIEPDAFDSFGVFDDVTIAGWASGLTLRIALGLLFIFFGTYIQDQRLERNEVVV